MSVAVLVGVGWGGGAVTVPQSWRWGLVALLRRAATNSDALAYRRWPPQPPPFWAARPPQAAPRPSADARALAK